MKSVNIENLFKGDTLTKKKYKILYRVFSNCSKRLTSDSDLYNKFSSNLSYQLTYVEGSEITEKVESIINKFLRQCSIPKNWSYHTYYGILSKDKIDNMIYDTFLFTAKEKKVILEIIEKLFDEHNRLKEILKAEIKNSNLSVRQYFYTRRK